MKGFKGFNSKLQCTPNGNVFQYEIGKTYTEPTAIPCHKGFHFVESPLDTLSYYGLTDGARYCEVDAEGVSVQTKDDTKRACTSITIGAEIKIPAIVKAAVKFVSDRITSTTGDSAHSATTGDSAHSATTGDYAHSATTGNSAHSATTGDSAHSATTGNSAHSATTGNYAHSATTGDSAPSATTGNSAHSATTGDYAPSATTGDYAHSATTGYYAPSATTGYSAHSATTGDYAHSATTGDSAHSATTGNSAEASVAGKNAIASSLGYRGKAKGALGCFIVLAEYDSNGDIAAVGADQVDGKKIKANTFYVLKGAKFTEAK